MDVSTPSRRPRSAESCPWQADGRFAADLPLEDYPSTMLLRLAQAIQQQVSATYARAHGLSVAEWRMLARLNSEGSVQLATLCRALAMDKAYAGRLLRSLGAQSLVTVEADPAHGRRLIVAITPAGRALARRILPQARASQEQLLQVLDPQERAALYASLKKLQAALDDTAPQPASHATEQPAQQLAARLFEVLRGQPHAHGGEEILDVPGVEFVAVGLADAVDQPHLQRDDRHGRQRLRQQFQRAVGDGGVEGSPRFQCNK